MTIVASQGIPGSSSRGRNVRRGARPLVRAAAGALLALSVTCAAGCSGGQTQEAAVSEQEEVMQEEQSTLTLADVMDTIGDKIDARVQEALVSLDNAEHDFDFGPIEAADHFDILLATDGNNLTATLSPKEGVSPLRMQLVKYALADAAVASGMARAVADIEKECADAGGQADRLTITYVLTDASGETIESAKYSSGGLVASEDVSAIAITFGDVLYDELCNGDMGEFLEEVDAEIEWDPNAKRRFEAHGNEFEMVTRFSYPSYDIDTSKSDEVFRSQDVVEGLSSMITNYMDGAMDDIGRSDVRTTFRLTFEDVNGEVFETYLYSSDGIVEQ